jgi:hypothetical protein
MLAHLGQLEEAQKLHEANLEQREATYGRNSAGYAIGEATFAELLLWRRDLEGAERHIKSAVATLFRTKQQQFVAASALWAAIRAARYADEQPLLTPFHVLSIPQQVELIRACLRRAQLDPPEIAFLVLDELLERLEDSGGHDAPRQRVATALARIAAKIGAHKKRIELLSWIRQRLDERGEARQALDATMGLARAKADAGDKDGAEAAQAEARRRAEALDEAERTKKTTP